MLDDKHKQPHISLPGFRVKDEQLQRILRSNLHPEFKLRLQTEYRIIILTAGGRIMQKDLNKF